MRGMPTNYNDNLGRHQFWLVETPVVEAAFRQPGRPAVPGSLRTGNRSFRLSARQEEDLDGGSVA